MKQSESELLSELKGSTSPKEAMDLSIVAEKLMQTPQFTRSKEAHEDTWAEISSRMRVSRTAKSHKWKFSLVLAPALLLIVVAAVAFTSTALPGDLTYSLKRSGEEVRTFVAFSPVNRAGTCSVFMKRRADELATLSGSTSTATVQSLNDSILEEAQEFSEYADKATGQDQEKLQQQRVSDAKYVLESLDTALRRTDNPEQKTVIQHTIDSMNTIVNG